MRRARALVNFVITPSVYLVAKTRNELQSAHVTQTIAQNKDSSDQHEAISSMCPDSDVIPATRPHVHWRLALVSNTKGMRSELFDCT
jgi:hypothetical protein